MIFVDVTLPTVAENLALDEAMLIAAEDGDSGESLRLWDACEPFVVLGRGSKFESEVELEKLKLAKIPLFRRVSGGATILAAPGCMFYAVVLSLETRPHLHMLDRAHRFVMQNTLQAIKPLQPAIQLDGTCDLVVEDRKVSGNSLRINREWILYHGTLLLDMQLDLVSKYLKHPPREPDYRGGRNHADFLHNLNIDRALLASSLRKVWQAQIVPEFSITNTTIQGRIQNLVNNKYSQDEWNLSR